ncbi:ExeA family protein [Jannaschia donghaensis]|uniref:Putative secretion ATPase, PEP-CTERM locus subfamily n=1 Tax=Jannaschia donghaensis TaxID=420998 RepID=A0A0M6YHE9_9RHOB|nr:AAA family ATPase [Jannaschia donghaensis]CTQ49344.1 putative secretion ATPase, PEP-CTERM locus subfamily [Jannaschia donghaensis]
MSQLQSLYKEHFGMAGRPFSGLADASVIHWGTAQVRAHAALEYGLLAGAAFTVVTGDAGSGKTSLLLHMVETAPDDLNVTLVAGLRRGGGSVLPWILQAMGQDVAAAETETALYTRIQDLLIGEYAAGRRVVFVFDEAQNLSIAALDELRVLTNINTARDQLLQIVLCGQPALRGLLQSPELGGLAQRVAAWGRLTSLGREDLDGYIGMRLASAGGPEDLFTEDALDLVHAATGGLPRPINQLCELALVYAMTGGGAKIGANAIQQVLEDGLFMPPAPPVPPEPVRSRDGRLRLAVG